MVVMSCVSIRKLKHPAGDGRAEIYALMAGACLAKTTIVPQCSGVSTLHDRCQTSYR
jgi:hypothetical protein